MGAIDDLLGSIGITPDTGNGTPRAPALAVDASLGGGVRSDTGDTIGNLLRSIGADIRQRVTQAALSTPAGQSIAADAQKAYFANIWTQYGPLIIIGGLLFLFLRR